MSEVRIEDAAQLMFTPLRDVRRWVSRGWLRVAAHDSQGRELFDLDAVRECERDVRRHEARTKAHLLGKFNTPHAS